MILVDLVLGKLLPVSGVLLRENILSLIDDADQVYCLLSNRSGFGIVSEALLAQRQSKVSAASLLL